MQHLRLSEIILALENVDLSPPILSDPKYFCELGTESAIAGNFDAARDYLVMASERGNVEAMGKLAFCHYLYGNIHLAREYYGMGADLHDPLCMNNLGVMEILVFGRVDPAKILIKNSFSHSKNKIAMNNYAFMIEKTEGKENHHQAIDLYQNAYQAGFDGAMVNLGVYYMERDEDHKATECLLLVKGKALALYYLGLLSDRDEKTKTGLAERYYKKASKKNSIKAMINLGKLHERNNKPEKAQKYLLQAIETQQKEKLKKKTSFDLNKDLYQWCHPPIEVDENSVAFDLQQLTQKLNRPFPWSTMTHHLFPYRFKDKVQILFLIYSRQSSPLHSIGKVPFLLIIKHLSAFYPPTFE